MTSRSTFAREAAASRRGFTFVEVLIVLGLFALVGSLGLFLSIDSYRRSSFYADADLLVVALERARAEALYNLCRGSCSDGKPHGVHIAPEGYTVFQGASWGERDALADAVFPTSAALSRRGLTDVVFAPLTAAPSVAGDVVLWDGVGRTATITVESEGRITWTH